MIDAVIARLKECAPSLKSVESAAELAALTVAPPLHRMPAAYVIPLAERAGDNLAATLVTRQRVATQIGVVLVVAGRIADAKGGAQVVAIQTPREEIRAALLGWEPVAGHEPLQYVGGELLEFAGGAVWWQDDFATAYHIRSA